MGNLWGYGSPFITRLSPMGAALFAFYLSPVAIIWLRTFVEPGLKKTWPLFAVLSTISVLTTVVAKLIIREGEIGWLPWGWGWVLAYSFAAVILANASMDPNMYWLRWSTWWIGDMFAVPIFCYFASKSLSGYQPDMFFDRWIITGILMLTGLVLAMILWWGGMKTRNTTWADLRIPSEFYHTGIVWVILAAVIGHALLAVIFNRPNSWSANDWGWVVPLCIFVICAGIIDSFVVDTQKPGR
jgi:hypothetical protein